MFDQTSHTTMYRTALGPVTLGCAGGGDHPARVAQDFRSKKDGTGYLFPSNPSRDTWVTHDMSAELKMGPKAKKWDLVIAADSKSQS